MTYVEIELGADDWGYGYIAHAYSEPYGGEYMGPLTACSGFDDAGDARRDAEAWLDAEYGEGNWQHI